MTKEFRQLSNRTTVQLAAAPDAAAWSPFGLPRSRAGERHVQQASKIGCYSFTIASDLPRESDHMQRLSNEFVAALTQAVVELNLDRDALLSGIDPAVVSAIPSRRTPAEQLLTDLHELNNVGRLVDGSDPLRCWLINASTLSCKRQSAIIFLISLRIIGFPDGDRARTDEFERTPEVAALASTLGQASAASLPIGDRSNGAQLRRLKSLFASMVYLNVEQTGLTTYIERAMPIDGTAWESWVRPTIERTLDEANQILELLRTIAREGDDLPLDQQSLYRRIVSGMRERTRFYRMFLAFRFPPDASAPIADTLKHSLCDIDSQYRRLVGELHLLGDALEDYLQKHTSDTWAMGVDAAQLSVAGATKHGFYHDASRPRLAPNDANKTFARAEVNFGLGAYSEALSLYRLVDDQVPGMISKFRIAMCFDALGRAESAVEAYYRFLDSYPNPATDDEYVSHARRRIEHLVRTLTCWMTDTEHDK